MSEQAYGTALLASLGRYTEDTRLIRLTTPLGEGLLVECMHGEEGISQGYSFKVDALCTDVHLQLRRLVGQPALLQLLTATHHSTLRPFHGYITSAEITAANGGFVRYALTIEPWTKFLSLGRDSRTFQDLTVFDILEIVFGSYAGRGKLVSEWRFDIADRSMYSKRSLSTQYQESDLAFVERLMHEEGLFYFFEHSADPQSPSLGCHTMVIADHNGAFKPNPQPSVEFTRPGAVMKADSIDRWRTEARLSANAVEMCSWDYRTFTLHGHARFDEAVSDHERNFVIMRVKHLMHNNLSADMVENVTRLLGQGVAALAGADEFGSTDRDGNERPLYRNRIEAILAGVSLRRLGADGHGHLLHPRPTVRAQQTAIVVGHPGAAVHTDRDHRVKVQFHWQRGAASHSRAAHPFPDGHTGAPGNDTAGTWVRALTPLAGANWSSNMVPRVGQYIKLEGGNIEVHAPGKVEFKASKKELAGPKSATLVKTLPKRGIK